MPLAALALALAAAAVHASWNTVAAGASRSQLTMGVSFAAGACLLVPAALLVPGEVSAEVAPFIAASAALKLGYFALLAAAYERGPLSVVYPISRGVGPVLVLAASVVVGASLSLLQAAGVLAVGLGVIGIGGVRASGETRDVAKALVIAACLAGYTLVDKSGIEHADPVQYHALVIAPAAVVYVGALLIRDGPPAVRAEVRPSIAVMGAAMVSSYLLVLAALKLAPAAAVAAVRETSVVMATAMAALFLGEPVDVWRACGAVVVVLGVTAVALG